MLGHPAYAAEASGGNRAGRLEYRSYRVADGLSGPDGLPYASDLSEPCQTLEIDLTDPRTGVVVTLSYTPLPDMPVLLRWARITNGGTATIELNSLCSASVDLARADLDLLTLDGAWAREHHIHRRPLSPGMQRIESRGGASGHRHAPFLALLEHGASEETGMVWAASLLYSGNHLHLAEVDEYHRTRLQSGANPFAFSHVLKCGGSIDTPATALVFSSSGLTGMSDACHRFVREALLPRRWRHTDRPIILNTWEAHYFDVNSEKVVNLAKRGAEIGAELLVLDDGWFVGRTDDTRALGDWQPDPDKFPGGLAPVANAVIKAGLRFGIWVEPEMVSPDSDLYRAHPEWALQIPGYASSLARNQLVLDLSRSDVVEYLLQSMTNLLQSAPISYVKWDMNRPMSEAGSAGTDPELQGSVMHRYMLGLYRLLADLTSRFPDVLFEGCAGGGGRFDFGMLAFMPQIWTSDQTDAVERQPIQYGSSLLFPPETMGAHVSAVPNHLVGRVTPAVTRGLTALGFNFGYELDLSNEPAENLELFSELSALYKKHRSLFREGRFLRLLPDASDAGRIAWAIVSQDRGQAVVFFFQTLAEANSDGGYLRVRGLDEDARYLDVERGIQFDAVFLRDRGLWLPPARGDYRSAYWVLQRMDTT